MQTEIDCIGELDAIVGELLLHDQAEESFRCH